jgi:glycosyltransferase involved in cell wall biosynthesis
MKVIFLIPSLGAGGAEFSTYMWGKSLQQCGWQVHFLLFKKQKVGFEQKALSDGLNIQYLQSKTFFGRVHEVRRVIRLFSPVIVHATLFEARMLIRWARIGLNCLLVESLVSTTYYTIRLKDSRVNRYGFYFYKFLDKFTSSRVNLFVAITHTVKQHYIKELQIPPKKISVIFRGRSPNPFLHEAALHRSAILQSLGLPANTLLILHTGRQEFPKAHDVLLRAFALLPNDLLTQCALICLGRQGHATPEVKQALKGLSETARVFFPGHVDDVPRWLAAADVFVFPSRYEGLGGAVIEAMAAGLPIIASDIPVMQEVVEDGGNADLVPVNDPTALARTLAAMLWDSEKRKRYGKRSLEIFRLKFQEDIVHQQLLACYENLLKQYNGKI